MKIKGEQLKPQYWNSDEAFTQKYNIPVQKNEPVDMERAMQIIWRRANTHLSQIDTLLNQSGK